MMNSPTSSGLVITMNLLLDTHTFIWLVGEKYLLSSKATAAILDTSNTLYLSTASVWEMQIKLQTGKLTLPSSLDQIVQEQQNINGVSILTIQLGHIYGLAALPLHHKDLFDRLIIAQSIAESMTVVGNDSKFSTYSINLLW